MLIYTSIQLQVCAEIKLYKVKKVFLIVLVKKREHHSLNQIIPFIQPWIHTMNHYSEILEWEFIIVIDNKIKQKT